MRCGLLLILCRHGDRRLSGAWNVSSVKKGIASAKHWVSDLVYERRYGVRTSGRLILDKHDAENVCSTPMNWRQLRRALPSNSVTAQDVFLDIGSGKGRAVLVAAKDYPFARVIGVEFVREFHDIAQSNLASVADRLRAAKVELICADLRDFEIPDDVTVMYMNNPGSREDFGACVFKHSSFAGTCTQAHSPDLLQSRGGGSAPCDGQVAKG
jgi:SAM-dependent methyltransferase